MPLRILVVHNYYQQPGGEDVVVRLESELLRARGHEVIKYERHNDELNELGRGKALVDTFWSRRSYSTLRALIERHRPDLVHCHNTFPLVSPSAYWAASRSGLPVIQTLHNFRLLCPKANFLREGKPCEDCLGRWPLPSILHGCYHGSRSQTAVIAGMLSIHRSLHTYRDKVSRYIALNEFSRRKFIEGGLPADRVVIKPNFVESRTVPRTAREGFLFVGRLSVEKGIDVLLRATALLPNGTLRVIGTGPEAARLKGMPRIVAMGPQPEEVVRAEMAKAAALVLPSIWYEGLPMVAIEAYAAGLPLIASRIGGLAELVNDKETGLLFDPANAEDLAEKMRWAQLNADAMVRMGDNARLKYEAQFTPERNYAQLMAIYRDAMAERA
jgi:glycosyltransferase involved in cell wall biosynthesis